ncbi:hypothetical protein SAMN04488061_1704 [Filomicrobium insigne]|uniref:Uncharacterized protein n=1 Tax=Filomicrobium insigne TaxID=418854 RepID=A0A1H0MJE6_9HYPH|nr:hypothetical protein SAMN04488061_1704 [Filomicrobium insigne]
MSSHGVMRAGWEEFEKRRSFLKLPVLGEALGFPLDRGTFKAAR